MVIPVLPPNFVTGVQKQSQEIWDENSSYFLAFLITSPQKFSIILISTESSKSSLSNDASADELSSSCVKNHLLEAMWLKIACTKMQPTWYATLYQTWHILWQVSISKSVWFDSILDVLILYYSACWSAMWPHNCRNGIWNDPIGLSVYGSLYLNVKSSFFGFTSVSSAWYWWRPEGGRLHYKTHLDIEYKHEKIMAASIPASPHYKVLQETRIGPSQCTVCRVVLTDSNLLWTTKLLTVSIFPYHPILLCVLHTSIRFCFIWSKAVTLPTLCFTCVHESTITPPTLCFTRPVYPPNAQV